MHAIGVVCAYSLWPFKWSPDFPDVALRWPDAGDMSANKPSIRIGPDSGPKYGDNKTVHPSACVHDYTNEYCTWVTSENANGGRGPNQLHYT